jgi:hypothetical protein
MAKTLSSDWYGGVGSLQYVLSISVKSLLLIIVVILAFVLGTVAGTYFEITQWPKISNFRVLAFLMKVNTDQTNNIVNMPL